MDMFLVAIDAPSAKTDASGIGGADCTVIRDWSTPHARLDLYAVEATDAGIVQQHFGAVSVGRIEIEPFLGADTTTRDALPTARPEETFDLSSIEGPWEFCAPCGRKHPPGMHTK